MFTVAVATVVLVIQQVTGEAYQLAKASNSFANRLYEVLWNLKKCYVDIMGWWLFVNIK